MRRGTLMYAGIFAIPRVRRRVAGNVAIGVIVAHMESDGRISIVTRE